MPGNESWTPELKKNRTHHKPLTMKNLIFVIFVLLGLTLSASAQTDRKSVDPVKFVNKTQKNVSLDEFAKTLRSSDAFVRTNALAIEGTKLPLEGNKFESMLTGKNNPNMRFSAMIGPGTHTLSEVSPTGAVTEVVLQDTILEYAVLDLSTFVRIDSDDEGDPGFLFPANQVGTNRIFKSYTKTSSEGGADGGDAVAKNSTGVSSDEEAKFAEVQWIKEGESFFYDGFLYQQNAEGKWESEDPRAPKAIKVGDNKNSPTFLFDKNGELVASDKRNAYKFGLGKYAGFEKNYYRHARNGAPLGSAGAYGYPVSYGGLYQTQPFMGMGMGQGFGMGNCFGISIGASFGMNMGLYGGGNICNPYITHGYVIGHPVWDPYTQRIFHAQTGGYAYGNGGGFGYGGCKSAVVNTPVVESAEAKVSQVETAGNGRVLTNGPVDIDAPKSNVGGQFDFTDIAPKDLRSSGVTAYAGGIKGSDDGSVMADHSFSTNPSVPVEKTPERQVTPTLEFGDSHTGVGLRGNGGASMGGSQTGNSQTKPQQEPLAFGDSHTSNKPVGARTGSNTPPTQKPLAQDRGGVIQAPAPVGRNTGDVASSGTVNPPTIPPVRSGNSDGRTAPGRTDVGRNADVAPSANTVSPPVAPPIRGGNTDGRTVTGRSGGDVNPPTGTFNPPSAAPNRNGNSDGRTGGGRGGSNANPSAGAFNPSGTLRGGNSGGRTGGGRTFSTATPGRSKQ